MSVKEGFRKDVLTGWEIEHIQLVLGVHIESVLSKTGDQKKGFTERVKRSFSEIGDISVRFKDIGSIGTLSIVFKSKKYGYEIHADIGYNLNDYNAKEKALGLDEGFYGKRVKRYELIMDLQGSLNINSV